MKRARIWQRAQRIISVHTYRTGAHRANRAMPKIARTNDRAAESIERRLDFLSLRVKDSLGRRSDAFLAALGLHRFHQREPTPGELSRSTPFLRC